MKKRSLSDLESMNLALEAQVKSRVRAEQQLWRSQLELGRQLERLQALSTFSLQAGESTSASDILELAAQMMFELFAFEQAVGFVPDSTGRLMPVAVSAVSGRVANSKRALEVWSGLPAPSHGGTTEPHFINQSSELPEAVENLLRCADELFEERVTRNGVMRELVLPIVRRKTTVEGCLVVRRLTPDTTFHQQLPAPSDLPFLTLASQQVALALASAQFAQRERLAALGELSAVVAHEVRNPLAVIFNSITALRPLLKLDERAGLLMQMVSEEARRINRIVSDLLDFAQPRALIHREENLADLIRLAVESARMAAQGNSPQVLVEAEEPDLTVMVDPRIMRQVFVNLVENSFQAAGERGHLRVKICRERDPRATSARVEISDDGPGIKPSHIGRVFEPFFTTKATGTGLGLAVVKRFVEAHYGQIRIENNSGAGTTVKVWLPTR